jgi:1-acyl-sn-glycerol-3-phosphate acyltransferase
VILAETRKTVQDDLDKLYLEINEITTDLLGIPPDDVVLLPPRRLLKTSSGKIRRAALRELYEQNRISKSQKATWLQVVSFGLAGLKTQIRRFLSIIYEGAYAGYVWALFSFVTPIVWVTVVLLPVYSWRWSFIHWTGRFLVSALRIPLIVNGLENLPDADPCILVVNHASYIDSFVMVAALPRNFRFVAKSELANSFGAQFFLSRLGTEFVERFDKQKSIEDARRITKSALEGSPLLFYPEGTLTRIPGLLPFHMGAFQTAAEGGLTIVPIAIRGSRSILRGGTWFPRRGPITITITSPIKPRKKKDGTKEQLWKTSLKLRDESREQILHYCGEPNLAHEQSPLLKLI